MYPTKGNFSFYFNSFFWKTASCPDYQYCEVTHSMCIDELDFISIGSLFIARAICLLVTGSHYLVPVTSCVPIVPMRLIIFVLLHLYV